MEMEFFQRRVKPVLRQISLGVLTCAVIGISLYSRDFAKIRIGPLFVLEAIALVWILITACTGERPSWSDVWSSLWAPLLFFLYGLCLTAVNVYRIIDRVEPLPSFRMAQHAILYVYPFLWMGVGWWTARQNRYFRVAVYGSLATALRNLVGLLGGNISLGPILNLPWLQSIHRWIGFSKERRLRGSLILIVMTILACLPFWLMWLRYVQRTSFLLFIFSMFLVPLGLRHKGETISRMMQSSLTALWLYVGGQALTFMVHSYGQAASEMAIEKQEFEPREISTTSLKPVPKPAAGQNPLRIVSKKKRPIPVSSPNSAVKPLPEVTPAQSPSSAALEPTTSPSVVAAVPDYTQPIVKPLSQPVKAPIGEAPTMLKLFSRNVRGPLMANVKNAVVHGEDHPIPGQGKNFVMRKRRFMWKMAVHDWRQHPWTGIGFAAEVPSYVQPGLTNVEEARIFRLPPVAGPHNSYLSVLARTGVIGSVFFACILGTIFQSGYQLLRRSPLALDELILCFVPFNGLFYALLNSGLESPHNCFLLWLYSGMLIACANGEARGGKPHAGRGEWEQGRRSEETIRV